MREATPDSGRAFRELADQWQALAESRAEVPLFMGRDWVESWLEAYGSDVAAEVWPLRKGSDLVGACLLVERRERRGPIPVRCVHLHTAGETPGEGVCVEYNELLARSGARVELARALGEALRARGVDELVAGGLTERSFDALAEGLRGWRADVEWSEDAFVDLARVRDAGGDYRGTVLSSNSRKQINRSLKAYAEIGPVEIEVVERGVERKLALLDELIALHQDTWRARGEGGAFGAGRMRDFHRRMIERTDASGAAHLVRVAAGDETIGVLYNFVDRGRVYFYQSGLRYRDGQHYRPGLSAHVHAIEHYLAHGMEAYHFLAGDLSMPRYKQQLSSDARRLAWARFQRPGPKASLVRGLRAVKAAIAGGGGGDDG